MSEATIHVHVIIIIIILGEVLFKKILMYNGCVSPCILQSVLYLIFENILTDCKKRVGFSSTSKVWDKHVIGECELDKYAFENRQVKVTFCRKGVLAQQLK